MDPAAGLCPECGTARPRRAAGCAHCGAIFDTGVEPAVAARARAAAQAPGEASPQAEPAAERGGGCGAVALLALIVSVLTLVALGAVYFLARREFTPLVGQFERIQAESDLQILAERIEAFAARHDGRLPESLFELSQERVEPRVPRGPAGLPAAASEPDEEEPASQSLDLIDPWGGRIAYQRDAERGPARLTCLGADGQAGGTGLDADLERWLPAR